MNATAARAQAAEQTRLDEESSEENWQPSNPKPPGAQLRVATSNEQSREEMYATIWSSASEIGVPSLARNNPRSVGVGARTFRHQQSGPYESLNNAMDTSKSVKALKDKIKWATEQLSSDIVSVEYCIQLSNLIKSAADSIASLSAISKRE